MFPLSALLIRILFLSLQRWESALFSVGERFEGLLGIGSSAMVGSRVYISLMYFSRQRLSVWSGVKDEGVWKGC